MKCALSPTCRKKVQNCKISQETSKSTFAKNGCDEKCISDILLHGTQYIRLLTVNVIKKCHSTQWSLSAWFLSAVIQNAVSLILLKPNLFKVAHEQIREHRAPSTSTLEKEVSLARDKKKCSRLSLFSLFSIVMHFRYTEQ